MPRAINTEVRERVVAGAYALFVERGYKSVSMDDVAKATGIKKANLFHYYPTKEALGLAVLEVASAAFRERIKGQLAVEGGDPIERITAMFRDTAQRAASRGSGMSSLVGNILVEMSSSHPSLQRRLAEDIAYWVDLLSSFLQVWKLRGYFGERMDPSCVAVTLVALLHGSVVHWQATSNARSFEDVGRCVADYLDALKSAN